MQTGELNPSVDWPTSRQILSEYLATLGIDDGDATAIVLLREFGSVSELMAGSWWRLRRTVGRRIASSIAASRELMKIALKERLEQRPLVSSRKDLLEFLHFSIGLSERESLWAIYLDSGNRLIRIEPIAQGSVMEAKVDKIKIIQTGLNLGAIGVILVHNHPSGDPTPSEGDLRLTRSLRNLMEELDMHLVDHLIVARGGVRSAAGFDPRVSG